MNNLIEQYKYNTPYRSVFSAFSLNSKQGNKNYHFKVENDKINNPVYPDLNLSYSAASLIIGSGLSLLMFSRSAQKNLNKYLNNLKQYFEMRKEICSIEESKRRSKLYDFAIKKLSSIISQTEIINNITSLKDVLFMNFMYATKPTKKIHQSITTFFKNLSHRTVEKSYKTTEKKFERMYKTFDNLDDFILKDSPNEIVNFKGKDYTKKELVKMGKIYRENAKILIDSFMSEQSQKSRLDYITDVNSTLYSTFREISLKDFCSKDSIIKRKEIWRTFLAAEKIKGDKTKLAESVALVRNAVTYTTKDKVAMIHDYVKKLGELIPPKDDYGYDIVEKLEWFTKNSDGLNNNKEVFLKELDKLYKYQIPSKSGENVLKVRQESKDSYIRLINELLHDNTTGELQDMLSIYYKIAPFEMSKFGALLSLKNAVKSFDKSVNTEISEFFDKIRDLELGSAPTDILTVLVSLGLIIPGLHYAPNDDQKLSIMLKSGIPVVGALVTSILSATKLVSGAKSISLGAVSGFLLNRIGIFTDKLREKYKRTANK